MILATVKYHYCFQHVCENGEHQDSFCQNIFLFVNLTTHRCAGRLIWFGLLSVGCLVFWYAWPSFQVYPLIFLFYHCPTYEICPSVSSDIPRFLPLEPVSVLTPSTVLVPFLGYCVSLAAKYSKPDYEFHNSNPGNMNLNSKDWPSYRMTELTLQ